MQRLTGADDPDTPIDAATAIVAMVQAAIEHGAKATDAVEVARQYVRDVAVQAAAEADATLAVRNSFAPYERKVFDLPQLQEEKESLQSRWSQLNVALAFIGSQNGEDIAFDKDAGVWRLWGYDGWYEVLDVLQEIGEYVRILTDGEGQQFVKDWGKASTLRGIESLARPYKTEAFDAKPDLVGLTRGPYDDQFPIVLDTNTGEVANQLYDDFISRRLPIRPAPFPSKQWKAFVDDCLSAYAPADRQLVHAFLQEWAGAALSGHARRSDGLAFLLGPPGTGKSTFAGALCAVFGEYGATVQGVHILKDRDSHLQWLANLRGKRLAWIDEVPRRGEWQTHHVNALVDGRPITANRMRQDDLTFVSQAHVIVTGNRLPAADVGEGIWSRLVVVSFENKPTKDHPDMLAELLKDSAGILAWALDGRRRTIRKKGVITIPPVLRRQAERVQKEADPVGLFMDECLVLDTFATVSSADLRAAFEAWWKDNGEGRQPSDRTVAKRLTALGIPPSTSINSGKERGRIGVRLVAQ